MDQNFAGLYIDGQQIVSIAYELELVPAMLIQQGLCKAASGFRATPSSSAKRSLLVRRSFERSNESMGALLASRAERFWPTDDNFARSNFRHIHPRAGRGSGRRDRLQLRPDEVSRFRCVTFQLAA